MSRAVNRIPAGIALFIPLILLALALMATAQPRPLAGAFGQPAPTAITTTQSVFVPRH